MARSPIRHSPEPVLMYCWSVSPTKPTPAVDPTTAPHDCDMPGCPGPENKRTLEAFPLLLGTLALIAGVVQVTYTEDREQDLQDIITWCRETAQAAIAKAQEKA